DPPNPPGRTHCSPPRLQSREDVAELADEAPSSARPSDPGEPIIRVVLLQKEEVHERIVAENPPERARVATHVPEGRRREAEGEPGPLEERGLRAGCDDHLAVRAAAVCPPHA